MKINVTANEYPNIVVAYLFDKLLNPEVSKGNKDFDLLVEDMRIRGMLPLVRTYYLQMDAKYRVKYKLVKDVFLPDTPENDLSTINIYGSPENIKKVGLLKKILKKVLGMKEQFTPEELEMLTEALSSEEDLLNE
jgi:hypothetical protein